METSSWQTIWFYLFFIASLMFYGTVTMGAASKRESNHSGVTQGGRLVRLP